MGIRRSFGRWLVVTAILGTAALASCSSGSGGDGAGDGAPEDGASEDGAAAPSPDDQAAEDFARLGGPWTVVRWTEERSDDAEGTTRGLARVARWRIEATCDEGPCDLIATADGADGTFLPEGVPTLDDGVERPDSLTLERSDEDDTYTIVDGPRTVSCTSTEGEVVRDAYEFTATTTLAFEPPNEERPASLHGTWTEEAESTPEGEAAGCTSYGSNGSIAASGTGTVASAAGDLSGSYVATEIVGVMGPDQRVPVGQAAPLGPMTISTDGGAMAITGTLGTEAVLAEDGAGWTGTAELGGQPCTLADGSEVSGAYDRSETWSRLVPIVITQDGLPILGVPWSSTSTSTAAGEAAGCPTETNEGYLILVPDEALA